MNTDIRVQVVGNRNNEEHFFTDVKKADDRFGFSYASDIESALFKAVHLKPQIVISEMLVGEHDAIELCRLLRDNIELSDVVMCILTDVQDDYAEIAALNAGIDAFVKKPIAPVVFAKKLNALLKRKPQNINEEDVIKLENASVQINGYGVVLNNETIDLPRIEFSVLKLLAVNKGKIFSREEIKKMIWGVNSGVSIRTIDVHIRNIRKKTGAHIIETVKGAGYKVR